MAEKREKRETVIRTVRQYNSEPIKEEDFNRLKRIAKCYRSLKSIAFDRYGGINGLKVIFERNAIQKELLDGGIRKELSLPSIYYQMALKEAVANIRKQWTVVRERIRSLADKNPAFSESDIHYIRFILKVDQAFASVMLRKDVVLPEGLQESYEALIEKIDTPRLDNYIRNRARKYHSNITASTDDTFSVDYKATNI